METNKTKETEKLSVCLVFVPHQDDEINLIGNCSRYLLEFYDLYVIYSSLDTDIEKSEIRKFEAKKSCEILGIPGNHIFFMGYPDTPNSIGNHFFEEPEMHHKVVADICHILKFYKPELIIGTDFDYHSDHRMLSIALEEAVCQCINKNYQPFVLKGFCYETAYYGIPDYSAVKLGKTKIFKELLSNPSYEWKKRVSLPTRETEGYIWKKRIYFALKQHMSQYAVLHAASIINADNVFWNKRTDNIALYSDITCSSGNNKALNDFKIIDTDDIITIDPRKIDYTKGLWKPENSDKEPWINIVLPSKSYIEKIIFHGNPGKKGQTTEIEIFINDCKFICKNLNDYGRETRIEIHKDNIQEIKIRIKKRNKEFALSEIEVFEADQRFHLFSNVETETHTIYKKYKSINTFQECINSIGFNIIILFTKIKRKLSKIYSIKI